MKKLNKGFTLVELLVVMAIIALLTSLIIVNIYSSRGKARDAKRVSDLNQIQLALEQFFDRCQVYPTTLTTSSSNGSCTGTVTLGNFISVIPTDPKTHSSYTYANDGSSYLDYILRTTLEYPNNAISDGLNGTYYTYTCDPTLTLPTYCIGPK
jgi:prepilin-type N-terminal cleavage/methylation domain-containing protein